MKITVDVDCTPEEARSFLGLPDLKPMQDALLAQLQERLSANLHALEPETLLATWLSNGLTGMVPGFEGFAKALRNQLDLAVRRETRP